MTPCTVAHEALLSVEFSRQEYWSGLPFPSPTLKRRGGSLQGERQNFYPNSCVCLINGQRHWPGVQQVSKLLSARACGPLTQDDKMGYNNATDSKLIHLTIQQVDN